MIAIVSVFIDRAVLDRYLLPSIPADITERHFIEGTRPSNMAALYNRVLLETAARVVIFSHPDVEFPPETCHALADCLQGDVAVAGLVGVVSKPKYEYIFSDKIDKPQDVDSLDSCLLVVNRDLGIRFDASTFDELHLYGEDYCYAARAMGFKCLVLPAARFNHASVTFKQHGDQWGHYTMYRSRLLQKWSDRFRERIVTT